MKQLLLCSTVQPEQGQLEKYQSGYVVFNMLLALVADP